MFYHVPSCSRRFYWVPAGSIGVSWNLLACGVLMQGGKGCVQQVPWGSWVLNVLFVVFELVASVILSYLKWWVAGADCLLDIYK